MSSNDREMVAVALGENTIVVIALADAVAEYLRLRDLNRDENESRVYVALELTLGTLIAGSDAQKLYEAL